MFIDRPAHADGVWGVDIVGCDGWVVEYPRVDDWKWFMNAMWVKKEFEVLAEL